MTNDDINQIFASAAALSGLSSKEMCLEALRMRQDFDEWRAGREVTREDIKKFLQEIKE